MCHFPETGESSSLKGDNLFPKDMTLCNHLVPSPFPGLERPSCEREVCVWEGFSVSDAISEEHDKLRLWEVVLGVWGTFSLLLLPLC